MDRSPAAQDPVPRDPYLESQMDIDEYYSEKVFGIPDLKVPLSLQAF